eukprot:3495542-Lingulodinium_polyedra.AAC.1
MAVAGVGWAEGLFVVQRPCSCKLKTQVIPQQLVVEWQGAMASSPFGPGVVNTGGRYLGACWPPPPTEP